MDDNAFSVHKNNRSGLSAAEFQRSLYNWFENRGLLDELRTRLRQQMIMALKDTSLRPSPSRRLKSNLSPKIQALNLLVAEFLLQQDHHYTLSVFTSEVPLLRSMPEFTKSGTHISADGNTVHESMPRFHHQDVKDIMEILGLPLDSEVGKRISCEYQDNSENIALLTCVVQNIPFVLKSMSQIGGKNVMSDHSGTDPTQENKINMRSKGVESSNRESTSAKQLTDFHNAEMQEVLYQSRLKSQHIKQLQEEIRRFQDFEVKRVQNEEEEKYKKKLLDRESQIRADICRREEEVTQKLKDAEDRLARQRQSVEDDLQTKQKQLQEKQLELARKLQQAEEHAEELKQQEKMIEEMKQREALLLAERTSELDVRQKRLHQEFERLNAERETLAYMQQELEENRLQLVEASRSLVHSQSQASFLHNLQQQCAHLRRELDATRERLDTLTEMQSQKSSHSKTSFCHHCSVEKVDKGLQTALPVPSAAVAESLPTQDGALDPEVKHPQLNQHQYLMDLMNQVKQENQELRGHTQQQRLRIDELTSHAGQLANQLEDAHAAITLLSNCPAHERGPSGLRILPSLLLHQGSVPPITAPAPPPAPQLPPFSPHHALRTEHSLQMVVGGEVSYTQSPPVSQPVSQSSHASAQHSSVHHRGEWRKKPTRRPTVHNNTTSSDETSPTEEILQEARRRLRRLEEESEAVDRSYRDFQLRHSESLAKTRSLLFDPTVLSTHFQQQRDNEGHAGFTPRKPTYSIMTRGGQNIQAPFILKNIKYDDKPPCAQHTLSRNERIPPFQYTKRSLNQSAFPRQLQTPGTIDRPATFISDRVTTQYPLYSIGGEVSASSRYATSTTVPQTDSRHTLQSQPLTGSGLQSRGTRQRKNKIDSANSITDRRGGSLHAKLLVTDNSSLDPRIHTQFQARNVSFGNSLKTITIYNSPQVSSLAGLAPNQNISHNELRDETPGDIYLKSADNTALSGSDRWGEDSFIKETDTVPLCMSYPSTSGTQGDDNIYSQFHKNDFCGDVLDDGAKVSVAKRLPDERNLQEKHKTTSSYLTQRIGSEFSLKETKSTDKDTADEVSLKESQSMEQNDLQPEKLYPVSDISALSSHEMGSLLSSRTTLNTGSLSNETDFQPVPAASHVSSTVFSSDSKDLSIECVSNSDGSSCNLHIEDAANKPVFISSAGTIPVQDEDILSEASLSGTQTTVQKREMKIDENSDMVISDIQDIREDVGKDTDMNKADKNSSTEILDVESNNRRHCALIVPDEVERNGNAGTGNNQRNEQDLFEQQPTKTDEKELFEYVLEGTKSREGFASLSEERDHEKDDKFTSLEAQRDDTAESVTDGSEQAISVGKLSNKGDSSTDDFW